MIKKLLSGLCMASAVFMLSSCLNDKEDEVTYYDDSAMTAFKLGTANRYHHTTASDGVTDSIYKTSYNAGSYVFYIDQVNRLVYNSDSLPYGTDATRLLATITTKNSGTVVLNLRDAQGKDSLAYYTATDSLDFSEPMRVRVYNMRGTAYREYTVRVNVHRQQGDELSWTSTRADALDGVGNRRYVNCGGQMYLFGVKDGRTAVFAQRGGTVEQLSATLDANAYNNVAAKGGMLYALSGGSLMQSADGRSWSVAGNGAAITRLIGASDARLYAMGAAGLVSSADDGATWTAEQLDDAAANLPTDQVNLVCQTAAANAQTNTLVLVGTRGGETVVWRKIEENGAGAQSQPWAFYPKDEYNKHTLPVLDNLCVMGYGRSLVALGGNFDTFYFSDDQGLTWLPNAAYVLPEGFGLSAAPFALGRDDENMIYISKAASAMVWSGRLARMGWAENR